MRKAPAPAEALLWQALRSRALGGFKFRRQHPIGPYVADFACVECMIVIELDGETHSPRKASDQDRTKILEDAGWHVVRFWNTDVYDELESVKEAIYQLCTRRSAPPSPLPLSPRR